MIAAGPSRAGSRVPDLSMAAASGWLCAQAWPTSGVRELAFVALIPFLMCVRAAGSTRSAAVLGWLWMLLFAWGINDWFPRAVARYYDQPYAVGFAFFLAVTTFSAAPASMLFASVYRRVGRSPAAAAPLLAAAAWTAGEFARTRLLGDPWGLLGYSQAVRPAWIQVADLTGVYGVGFVVMLVNAGVAELLIATSGRALTRALLLRCLAATVIVPVLVLAYGYVRLASITSVAAGDAREVLVVQGDIDFREQWRLSMHAANLERYLGLTRSALAQAPADVVVWPENAVTFYLDEDATMRREIADVLLPASAMLVVGGPRIARREPPLFRNSAFVLAADAATHGYYDKQRLLPFAEYQPLAAVDFMTRGFDGVREFSPGPASGALLDGHGLGIGVVICNEALFAEPARERVDAGARVLLALTNDSWVGEPKFAEQAFESAVLRAVEQRRWLVRSSTSGPSAIVDPAGRIVARTPLGWAGALRGRVAPRADRTFYARTGDAFAWLCVLAVAIDTAMRLRRSRDTL